MILRALKERKAKKYGLPANPTRCIDAEKRITSLEICSAAVKEKLEGIDDKVDLLTTDVKRILDLHLKK